VLNDHPVEGYECWNVVVVADVVVAVVDVIVVVGGVVVVVGPGPLWRPSFWALDWSKLRFEI
jgi:hypothetical protein